MTIFTKTAFPIAIVSVCLALSSCGKDPEIKFMEYGKAYNSKPNFAAVEYKYPLSADDLQKITPKYLSKLPQEQIDQIYARLSAGPIPDAAFNGDLFFPRGVSGDLRVEEILGGGFKGLAAKFKLKKLRLLGKVLWKGKVFYKDQMVLRNRINDLKILAPLIDGDLSTLQKMEFDDEKTWLLFPAKLYCAQSLIDSRRESINIDYAFTDDIAGYREMPDALAGRRGFKVRDEIRMIRPGFYLGRAYLDRAFILNFTLYNEELDKLETPEFIKTNKVTEDCFTGTRYVAQASP